MRLPGGGDPEIAVGGVAVDGDVRALYDHRPGDLQRRRRELRAVAHC